MAEARLRGMRREYASTGALGDGVRGGVLVVGGGGGGGGGVPWRQLQKQP